MVTTTNTNHSFKETQKNVPKKQFKKGDSSTTSPKHPQNRITKPINP